MRYDTRIYDVSSQDVDTVVDFSGILCGSSKLATYSVERSVDLISVEIRRIVRRATLDHEGKQEH